ncbi:acyl-CoA dehydrogenase family protein [Pseudonocardia kunmingensis]|uniref:Alkylation response protein AidB-like acyl-CoA dehydrogenase n=1 Tax=Pseudonocardia kunmingensis TaxID=630975 RepID=A0A543DPG2_9PSEU|nr:acyl-CoA dehydrogenase family protein [Pseudonocardia kunmingensis]TQM11220.1 alkylation response protein AidB-like acyl-CoA dehydrogenase [Pseudonocardia kunmingensis]
MSVINELRGFLEEHLPPFRAQWGDAPTFEGRLAWQATLQTGRWVAPQWAEEHGGRGLDVVTALACTEVLAEHGAPSTAGIFGVANVGPTIAQWGTPEQREHLPRILEGSELWCQGFSEPGAGSDLAGLQTRAVRDGDDLVVNGQKIWTSDGTRAHFMQLLVRTDSTAPKHKGISCLLVPLDTPGIERRPIRQITGESEFAEVFFTDARVPLTNLLGPLHEGWRVTMTTLGHERSGVVSYASAVQREIEATVERLRADRTGIELAPLLRDELVQRYVEGKVLGILGQRSLASIRATGQPGAEQSIIKLEWSLFGQRLARTRLALSGARAVVAGESDVATGYLRTRASTIAGGTTEIMKNILAQRVLGLPA